MRRATISGALAEKTARKRPFAQIELSLASLHAGDGEWSIAYVKRVEENYAKIRRGVRWTYERACQEMLFYNALYLKDLTRVAECFEKMRRIIAENASGTLENYQYALRVASGNYDGAETYYLIRLDSATRMLDRVVISWILGDLYKKLNQPEKSREYLEFVIQNGNTTRYVTQAKALLQD